MTMLCYRMKPVFLCLVATAFASWLGSVQAHASHINVTCHGAIASTVVGQFNFGLTRDRGNDDNAETPSRRAIPRLLGGGNDNDAADSRPDPFQVGDRESAVERLTSSEKSKAQGFLNKARAALAQGDLAGAQGWYHRAAALDVKYDAGEYSPARLKQDLVRAGVDPSRLAQPPATAGFGRSGIPRVQGGLPQLPSRSESRSPFADRVVTSPAEAARRDRLPSGVAQASHDEPSTGRFSRFSDDQQRRPAEPPARLEQGAGEPPQRGRTLLRDARRALAEGKPEKAAQLADEANRLGLRYSPTDDTPFKVRKLIEQHRKLMSAGPLSSPHAQTPQFKRAYAELLMQQADGLLGYGDYDAAESLARRAFQVKADFGSFQRTPAQLLAQIASRRRDAAQQHPASEADRLEQVSQLPQRLPAAEKTTHPRKAEAVALLAQARAALARGELDRAETLAQKAKSFNVPEEAFDQGDDRPWVVLLDIERTRNRRSGVQPAANFEPVGQPRNRFAVQPGIYRPDRDNSRVIGAQSTETPQTAPQRVTEGHRLFEQGEQALLDRKIDEAVKLFRQAWKHERQLDAVTRSRLQTYLQDLANNQPADADGPTQIDDVEARQQVLMQQLFSDVSRTLRQAEQMRSRDPKDAIERLKQLREEVGQSEVRAAIRDQQVQRIDRAIASFERYIEDNRAQIEQDERNRQILDDVERTREVRIEVQQKLAELVDEFNRLLDEHQFAEAEAIARQARELNPDAPVVHNMHWKVRFVRRLQTGLAIRERSEEGLAGALMSADESAIPFDDRDPYRLPDVRYWQELTDRRSRYTGDHKRRLTEADIAIYNALKTKVDVRFEERPLSEVVHTLAASAGINVHIDRQGLAAEGITSDTPVTINLTQPISLRSALNHILHELRLSYIVQDEVLKITSEQMRESDVHRVVYNVADLVIPIPNFTPSYNMGLAAALRQAHADLGAGWVGGRVNEVPLQVAGGGDGSHINPLTMGQMAPGFGGTRRQQPIGFGPGGVTGGVQPDFDSLIDLLTTTVAPTTWDEVGGPGSVVGMETNLSLVISQTQEVHDEIVDLLEQLRRLQDLQVTIEVRFITLNDNFFERIGIDFDFDIDDNVQELPPDDGGPSVTIGLDQQGQPTADFDVSFAQDSFAAAVPQFGGFDPATAANFGFAILGEIEAFFLIQAAQGDTRTNVMQAPKVTLFNGQQAFVSDTSQTPFVTSVIPVVGDFAAAHQPVIIVLTEGTSLSVQAVVSPDRRFVRLTIVPFFSKIDDVQTFTFEGRTRSSSSQTTVDPDEEGQGGEESEEEEEIVEGTTVQLPTFSFVTVTTTVSVPDGGTVLLGGVKRLSEGRTERGVPMLNKLPYVQRLFKNVGIGRDTQSLMMMVTPRIIIQEEEEEKLGIGGFGTGTP